MSYVWRSYLKFCGRFFCPVVLFCIFTFFALNRKAALGFGSFPGILSPGQELKIHHMFKLHKVAFTMAKRDKKGGEGQMNAKHLPAVFPPGSATQPMM